MSKASKDVLSPSELSTFCAQIGMILKSGIPVSEGVSIMYDDMKNESGREILGVVRDEMELGAPLHMALEKTGKFPKYMLDMVEIGDQSGKLEEVMDSLVEYYEREENIAQSVRSAVTYPLIMIVMMVLVIGVLVVEVLPIFNQVFIQLGSQMSDFARSIMNIGALIGRYSFVIVGVIVLLLVVYAVMRGTKGGQAALARFRASFFVTRRMSEKIASGRFASAMSLMLSSGMDTDQSLDMVEKLVDHPVIHEKIAQCRKKIGEGESFSNALAQAEIFAGVYARMVSVGFKTGSTDLVMKKLADRYEKEIDTQISNLIAILEPTLVAVLSVIVGLILLSVMLPLMGIMSSIG